MGISVRTGKYTLGVEEEYQVVDPETRELRAHGRSVLRRARQIVGEEEGVEPELLASQVEAITASRHGLDEGFLDVEAGRILPAREMIEKLLDFAHPALEESEDWEEVSSLARETLERGNGAARQREAYERSGRLEDVVDMLLEETARGTSDAS